MLDKPVYYPLGGTSALLQQQEQQLRQYTLAAMSARERDRERASPEPHLEIMRPVSPFQNKRQLAHQQPQPQPQPKEAPQVQRQREQPAYNSHYQTNPSSQLLNRTKPQESNVETNSKPHSSAHATRSGPRARFKDASRSVRSASRDTDISPALKMMNYDTGAASPSSEREYGRSTTILSNSAGMLAPPGRSDMSRSTSPEGGVKRRNPGWRKPVPKYIPTPPSTPPSSTLERLPSTRVREEPIPPVPHSSSSAPNVQTVRPHPSPAKSYNPPGQTSTGQTSLPRPARAVTDHQPPAQVYTRQNVRVAAAPVRNVAQVSSSPRIEGSAKSQVQATKATTTPQVLPPAYTTDNGHASPPLSSLTIYARSPSRQPTNDRVGTQQDTLVHPQPRKVPSMAQLVAMVLPSRSQSRSPSRTPSPGIPQPVTEPTEPLPLQSTFALGVTPSETLQTSIPSLSVNPPSPVVIKGETHTERKVLPAALLQPDLVQLPPSGNSSARSSRSPSPQASPRHAAVSLPARSRSRSPTPVPLPIRSRSRSPTPAAVIPQCAPPPPSTPIAVPKTCVPDLLQPLLSTKLAEKAEATAALVQATNEQERQVSNAPGEAGVSCGTLLERPSPSGNSKSSTDWMSRDRKTPTVLSEPTCTQEESATSHESANVLLYTAQQSAPVAERHSPPPIHPQAEPSQVTSPVATKVIHAAKDVVTKERPNATSVHGPDPLPSSVDRALVARAAERVAFKDAPISRPPRAQSPPTEPLQRTATPIRPSVNSKSNENSQASDTRTIATAVVLDCDVPVRKRPVPVPMNEHAQVSRESGLVTPPDTPPGSTTATLDAPAEDNWVALQERGHLVHKPDVDVEAPPRSPEAFSVNKSPVSKGSIRRRALIQDEQPSWRDERAIKEARHVSHPIGSITSCSSFSVPPAVQHPKSREPATPPLPADWKETITNVSRPNISPNASQPVPPIVEPGENHSASPRTKPPVVSYPQTAKTGDAEKADKFVVRGVSTEHVEHESMVLGFHIHEVETRRVIEAYQIPEKGLSVKGSEQHPQLSMSPRHKGATSELPPGDASIVSHEPIRNYAPPGVVLRPVPPEEPVHARSPVPRRKAPQQYNEANSVGQEGGYEGSTTTRAEEPPASSTTLANPSAQRSGESYQRNNSSGLKRKGRTPRVQPGWEDRKAPRARVTDPIDKVAQVRDAEGLLVDEVRSALADSQAPTNCVSPPHRLQSLGGRKRLPLNGSEPNLPQPSVTDSTRDDPSSPYAAARSLPVSPQPQPPARPPRHVQGQHKRLPAPEVTQPYRPPTPPIPSHYKKKSSNDVLPPEPPTFMKPAVHVIYPDTSTSHGHSLSGDSLLNMSNYSKPSTNPKRAQPNVGLNTLTHKEDVMRARSPSPAILGPQEDDDGDDAPPEAYPQVPPKTRRHEMNNLGSPCSSDRLSEFAVQHATRGQVRYPSAPVGQARAHILMLPPSSNSSKSRTGDNVEGSNLRPHQAQQPHAKKAARSQSEKVLRKNDKVQPLARSRSTPIPSSRQRSRRGFWRIFGLWARVFMAKVKTWTSPTPSPSQSSEYGYYDTY